ncbi:DUF3821 domain-containing protein [Methanoregula sp.]|uniref:DUF3821 domain-containing protein n=1 Tax=Methanoregula sp. TaxID=2052170 RepID=UPI002372F92A|nr:DUF3821 domain-containing protein [Methanoregula sp.]MDD1686031.1 DUF3821 domain-containing protein [Methanoregula sp.]
MRRIFFDGILIVFLLLAGCVTRDTNLTVTGPPPATPGEPQIQYGGSALAISFSSDGISTTSPEAKELFIKGLAYSTQYARYNESLEFFDAALAIDTNFSEAWVAKGVALHNMKRYDEAVRNYDRALLISPGDAEIWHVKCITLNDAGRSGEAVECGGNETEPDLSGYRNTPVTTITPIQTQSCDSNRFSVPAGGDIFLGERCLDVSAGVSSGQVISWYKNGRNAGNSTPDVQRIIHDSGNFSVNPDDFLDFEGPWYVGTTDKVAFIVWMPVLNSRSGTNRTGS